MRRATLLLGVVLLASIAREAAACSCSPGTPESRYASANLVFRGNVRKMTDRGTILRKAWAYLQALAGRDRDLDMADDAKTFGFKVDLDVTRTWRGAETGKVTLFTGRGGGDCGVPFVVGTEYLVYGHCDRPGDCYTWICSRTRPVYEAGDDLRYLASLTNDMRPSEK